MIVRRIRDRDIVYGFSDYRVINGPIPLIRPSESDGISYWPSKKPTYGQKKTSRRKKIYKSKRATVLECRSKPN